MLPVPCPVFTVIGKYPVRIKLSRQIFNGMEQNLMILSKVTGKMNIHSRLINPVLKIQYRILQFLQHLLCQKIRILITV